MIEASAKCELGSVIRFLPAEGNSTAEIHRMTQVYGDNSLSDAQQSGTEWVTVQL